MGRSADRGRRSARRADLAAGRARHAGARQARSLLAKHRVAWLGELAKICQHREGLVFDRGLLAQAQIQVKSVPGLTAAIGSPLWAATHTLYLCDRFGWDIRIAPLLAHPAMRSLRAVYSVGANVVAELAKGKRALPIETLWLAGDYDVLVRERGALANLATLGFTRLYEPGFEILDEPIVTTIATLGVTSDAPAGEWLRRARTKMNLTTLELRRHWIPVQGPLRHHWIQRFSRDASGAFARVSIEPSGTPGLDQLADDLASLRGNALEVTSSDPDVVALFTADTARRSRRTTRTTRSARS